MLEVALADPLRETRVVSEPVHDPGQGGLLLAVERFGLSGSNITYAQVGNQFGLGYWRPFPAEDGWGRVLHHRELLRRGRHPAGGARRPARRRR